MPVDLTSFGRAVSSARKAKQLSQKELAAIIKKEDGESITPQYLNDIEHDRRSPSSDHLVKQFSKVLHIDANVLYSIAGILPEEDRKLVKRATAEKITEAFMAFRKELKG
jgi:transcriptional regulator with XRE-family HTH domain